MEDRKEKNTPWLSVPQFGDWDQKGVMPDYSLDFSKIRENRKQNKRDVSRASLGNEEELISSTATTANSAHRDHQHHHFHQDHSPTVRFLAFTNQLCYMFTGSCCWLRFIGFILLGYLFISFIICILAPLNTASYMQIVVVFSYYQGSNTVLSTKIRFIVVVINLARNIIKKKIFMIMGCV